MTAPLERIAVSSSWSFLWVKLCVHLPQDMDYISFPVTECVLCFSHSKQYDIEMLYGAYLGHDMSFLNNSIRETSEAIKRK